MGVTNLECDRVRCKPRNTNYITTIVTYAIISILLFGVWCTGNPDNGMEYRDRRQYNEKYPFFDNLNYNNATQKKSRTGNRSPCINNDKNCNMEEFIVNYTTKSSNDNLKESFSNDIENFAPFFVKRNSYLNEDVTIPPISKIVKEESNLIDEKSTGSNKFYDKFIHPTTIMPIIYLEGGTKHHVKKNDSSELVPEHTSKIYRTDKMTYLENNVTDIKTHEIRNMSFSSFNSFYKNNGHEQEDDKKTEIESLEYRGMHNKNGAKTFRKTNTIKSIPNIKDLQPREQNKVTPCFNNPKHNVNFILTTPQNMPLYIINPATSYHYIVPTFSQVPQYIPNYLQYNDKTFLPFSDYGQFYMCNPIPPLTNNNNIISMPDIEIRRDTFNLQELIQNPIIPKEESNILKSATVCPNGQQSCLNGNKCISSEYVCDNEVNCDDASDELLCSCRKRIAAFRICDGFFDCPNGEDEQGCFGCAEHEFSCDDWTRSHGSTCIPLNQRCDNIRQCILSGKDEEDCSVLANVIGQQPQFKISNTVGFLHRNYKGKWYPTCLGTNQWAREVCRIEAGPSIINPKFHMMLTSDTYKGQFIDFTSDNKTSFTQTCFQNHAAFVECPAIYCGLRITARNPYRDQEVETSVEELLNEFELYSDLPNRSSSKKNQSQIGNYNALGVSRVVGGRPSQPGAWPWLVSIYRNGVFHCGGVLFNELWIITAAHCVDRYWKYYYQIEAGMLRRFSYSPMEQIRWINIVIPHKSYNNGILNNDIALMKLSSPVRYNRYVRPICLPSESTAGHNFLREPLPGTICTTVGWGATIEHGADPDHMREVEVPILDHCNNIDDVESEEICAGLVEGGRDACQGDSGGPLMCRNPNNFNQWYLAGIVSHGEGCARPHQPGVYTRTSKYVGWITENIDTERIIEINRTPLKECPGYKCISINKCIPWKRHCDKIVDCIFGDDEMNCIDSHAIVKYLAKHNDINLLRENGQMDNLDRVVSTSHSVSEKTSLHTDLNITDIYEANNTSKDLFKCSRMLQILPLTTKCNKVVDCEDGSDEMDCVCVDYLKYIDPNSICDGITDCFDMSDEIDCTNCKASEYYCRQSHKCIKLSQRCDGIFDCPKDEDEKDCVALTNGRIFTLDRDLRPMLRMNGIITVNHSGKWTPLCVNKSSSEATVASNTCNFLGFEDYSWYHRYKLKYQSLNVTIDGFDKTSSLIDYINESDTSCTALYVRCSNVFLDNTKYDTNQSSSTRIVDVAVPPWSAFIYMDGIYKCMGVIIDIRWIISPLNCIEDMEILYTNYLAVLLGKGREERNVLGPYEEIMEVVEIIAINRTDIILLGLGREIKFNRYIKPINLFTRRSRLYKERCIALKSKNTEIKYISLTPMSNCSVGYKCFQDLENKDLTKCQDNSPWTVTILCDSGNGWYLSAMHYEKKGFCGFVSQEQFTSINFHSHAILSLMRHSPAARNYSTCDGFRCKLGTCLNNNKVCNAIPECRGGEDEMPELCSERLKDCFHEDTCECPPSYLKCRNGRCVPKSTFCDKINDCGDYSDEPDFCSCREYMLLTYPGKVCDGVVNCIDRTDEDPKLCECGTNRLKCGRTSYCTSGDMICDGVIDCPNGEDEMNCLSFYMEKGHIETELNSVRPYTGEVMKRTGGIWHSGCFKRNYTLVELQDICFQLGYVGKEAIQFTYANETSSRPTFDKFSVVWLQRNGKNKFKIKIRSGNEPYIKFTPDSECYKLLLSCI